MKRGTKKKQFVLIMWLVSTILILLFLSHIYYYREQKISSQAVFQFPGTQTTQITSPEESAEVPQIYIVDLFQESAASREFNLKNFGCSVLKTDEIEALRNQGLLNPEQEQAINSLTGKATLSIQEQEKIPSCVLTQEQIDFLSQRQEQKILAEQQQVINFLGPNKVLGGVQNVVNAMFIKVTPGECLSLIERGFAKRCEPDRPLKFLLNASAEDNVKKIIGVNNNTSPPDWGRVRTSDGEFVDGFGTTIIVIDAGIRHDNQFFSDRILEDLEADCDVTTCTQGYGIAEQLPGDDAINKTWHGTWVTTFAAANDNIYNGKWHGVAPEAEILPIRILGYPQGSTYSHFFQALDYIYRLDRQNEIEPNDTVITMSLSEDIFSCNDELPFDMLNAVLQLHNLGYTIVTAAGNEPKIDEWCTLEGSLPRIDDVITVGGSTKTNNPEDERMWGGSSGGGKATGPTGNEYYVHKPDFVAPASMGLKFGYYIDNSRKGVVTMSGTSFAAPQVAGVIALMKQVDPSLQDDGTFSIKRALKITAVKLKDEEGHTYNEYYQGAGRVDARGAIRKVELWMQQQGGGSGESKGPEKIIGENGTILPPSCGEGPQGSTSQFWYKAQCDDGVDNNNDGVIDMDDENCNNIFSTVEYALPTCGNNQSDPGETSTNCCQDVGAANGYRCVNNIQVSMLHTSTLISSPYDGETVEGILDIKGTAIRPNQYTYGMYAYNIAYKPVSGGSWTNLLPKGTEYETYGDGGIRLSGPIDKYYLSRCWDTSILIDGCYNLKLKTWDAQFSTYYARWLLLNYMENITTMCIDNDHFIKQGTEPIILDPATTPIYYIYGNAPKYSPASTFEWFRIFGSGGLAPLDSYITLAGNGGTEPVHDNILAMLDVQGAYARYGAGEFVISLKVRRAGQEYVADTLRIVIRNPDVCNNCAQCTSALSDPYNNYIKLNQSITANGDCIKPGISTNKTFDCQGHTMSGTGGGQGFDLRAVSNYKIKNCNITGFDDGIEIDDSHNISINNTNINNADEKGIYLHGDTYNVNITNSQIQNNKKGIYADLHHTSGIDQANLQIKNNKIINNQEEGLHLEKVWDKYPAFLPSNEIDFNRICHNNLDLYIDNSNVTLYINYYDTNETHGTNVILSSGNGPCSCTCSNCVTCSSQLNSSNCQEIVYLTQDIPNHVGTCIGSVNFRNKIFDCQEHTIDGDDSGYDFAIALGIGNDYNTIRNCKMQGSYGLSISSQGNKFYNNLFNSSSMGASGPNIWNTTKTPGRNIVNGNFIGGNAWTNPQGTGFSDRCPDTNQDGICDLANGLDYLPLKMPGSQAPNYTCNSCADCNSKLNAAQPFETVALTGSISIYYTSCINIESYARRSYVTFDCQGNSIISSPMQGESGIFVNQGNDHITIKNCNVKNFWRGIIIGANDTTLLNNFVYNSSNQGVWLWGSRTTLINNQICSKNVVDIENQSSGSIGSGNTCDRPNNWNDQGIIGCTYRCYLIQISPCEQQGGVCALTCPSGYQQNPSYSCGTGICCMPQSQTPEGSGTIFQFQK